MATTCKHWLRAMACLVFLAAPVMAQTDWVGFLRLDGVAGESPDTNHPGWLPVQSAQIASLSMTNHVVAGQLCFRHATDKATPVLLHDLAIASNFPTGTLDLTMTNFSQMEFFRLNLSNIYLSSISQSGSAGGDSRPLEEICLLPRIFSWDYVQMNPSSGLPARYLASTLTLSLAGTNESVSTNLPLFMSTGIKKNGSVQLSWNATAGRNYRIYSVSDLTQPFVPLIQITATSSGPTNYTVTPVGPAMFFVVEQIPAGY